MFLARRRDTRGGGGMEGVGPEKRRRFAECEALGKAQLGGPNAHERSRSFTLGLAERPINCRAYRFRSALARGTPSVSDYLRCEEGRGGPSRRVASRRGCKCTCGKR
jgi:hypothetical protein